MGKLGEFILKRIEEKKTQRWIITCDDLFTLCGDMGIIEDDDTMMDIMDYLEENKIEPMLIFTITNLRVITKCGMSLKERLN